jgi:zinc protease
MRRITAIPNFTGDQIVDQVQDEIAKLQNTPVSAQELQRVKTLMRAAYIGNLQGSLNRAKALAQFTLADNNPELINTELEKVLAVTPEQIQAVAKKYLTPEKRSVLEIVPGPAPKESK